ncbi:unnamed protein product [Fusarium graminearum]|nr:unnamed protein product [Fusarium graminearum]CAG1964250.1 unnamed protein product [Fusarium graminearum]VTO86092.1 unnamed protein product [Fusarium graminearum]
MTHSVHSCSKDLFLPALRGHGYCVFMQMSNLSENPCSHDDIPQCFGSRSSSHTPGESPYQNSVVSGITKLCIGTLFCLALYRTYSESQYAVDNKLPVAYHPKNW